MEEQHNPYKRQADYDLKDDAQNKKLHIDPFAQLQLAMAKHQAEEVDQEQQRPLLKTKVVHQIEHQNWIHETFYPQNFVRTSTNLKFQIQTDNNCLSDIELSLRKVRLFEESIVICGLSSQQSQKMIESQLEFWEENRNKILIVCPSENKRAYKNKSQSKNIYFHDNINLQSDKVQPQSYQCSYITVRQLRRLSFLKLSILNRFDVIVWDSIQFDHIFQELLITMPLNINYFFIFKTRFGNTQQFLHWLTRLRARPFHLFYQSTKITTNYHVYGYSILTEGLYQLIDEEQKINLQNIQKINQSYTSAGDKGKTNTVFGNSLKKMVKVMYSLNQIPLILYSWTKVDIQRYALILCESLNLTTKAQKERIQLYFQRSQTLLDENQRKYSSISLFRQFLVMGIAIYHNGLIPFLKNLVKILWGQGLIKVLITDGRDRYFQSKNMVIFPNKKQGGIFSQSSKELVNYHLQSTRTQNNKKLFVLFIQQKIDENKLKQHFQESQINFSSSFQFTFHSFLNYQGFDDMDSKYILARTFKQYQTHQQLQILRQKQTALQQQLDCIVFQDIKPINSFNQLKEKQSKLRERLQTLVYTPPRVVPFLNVGRLIKLKDNNKDWGYGIVVNIHKIQQKQQKQQKRTSHKPKVPFANYLVDVLVCMQWNFMRGQPQPIYIDVAQNMQVLTFDFSCIDKITKISFTALPNNLKDQKNRFIALNSLKKLQNYSIAQIEFSFENKQVQQINLELQKMNRQIERLSYLMPIQGQYLSKIKIQKQLKQIKKQVKISQKLLHKKTQKYYHKLAKSIGMIEKGNLTQFGKAAATINNKFILLIMKMVKDGFYNNLSHSQTAALIVALVQDETVNTQRLKVINLRLRQKINQMLQMSKQIAEVCKQCKFQFDLQAYVDDIKEKYVEIVYQWCQGEDLQTICNRFNIYQGNMIRILHSLIDLIYDISKAAQILNLKSMAQHFSETVNAINRGIVANNLAFQ